MLLSLTAISKRFAAVHALRGVDFSVAPGEIHALLGENGAGKTTLMHIAYGLLRPDAGSIAFDGAPASLRSARDARRLGIGMVHQHGTAVPAFSVAENVALDAGWPVAPAALRRRVLDLTERLGLPLNPDAIADALPVALKQRLEIVKALAGEARILLLDEPTAVLAPAEIDELFQVVRGFARRGGAVVLITHKLEEALAIADRVTVLRRGTVTLSASAREVDAEILAHAMLGGETSPVPERAPPVPGRTPVLRCESLEVAREVGGSGLRFATFEIRGGEIVAVAALEGNGQRELLRAVAGLLPTFRGRLEVTRPIAFVPEDRSTEGLIPTLTLTENVVLGVGRAAPWIHGRWLRRVDWRAARLRTGDLLARYRVIAPGPDTKAAALSGGNQQKLVIARALERRPRMLIAENPTRGLDIRATAEVHERLREAAAAGAGVLVYSSDLDEVMTLGDRILIVAGGVVVESSAGADRRRIGELMLGMAAPRES
jgi:general nucleoside transport system ATP-binding protein